MARFRNSIFGYNKSDVHSYIESLLNDNAENIEELKKEKFKKEELLEKVLQENEKIKVQKEEIVSVLAYAITESENMITNTKQQINEEHERAFNEFNNEILKYQIRVENIKSSMREEINKMELERSTLEEKLNLLKKEYELKVEKVENINKLINNYKNTLNE